MMKIHSRLCERGWQVKLPTITRSRAPLSTAVNLRKKQFANIQHSSALVVISDGDDLPVYIAKDIVEALHNRTHIYFYHMPTAYVVKSLISHHNATYPDDEVDGVIWSKHVSPLSDLFK